MTGTCCSVCDDWYYYTTRGGVPVEDDGVCWSCRRIRELRWLRFCDAWQAIGMAAVLVTLLAARFGQLDDEARRMLGEAVS